MLSRMMLWFCAALILGFSARHFFSALGPFWKEIVQNRGVSRRFRNASRLLHEISDTLESGAVPSDAQWKRLETLDASVREVTLSSLNCLRDAGSPVVPTLKRLREWCDRQSEFAQKSQVRSHTSLMQGLVTSALVPISSVALYLLLDGLSLQPLLWFSISSLAFGWALLGALMILIQSEAARWGGLARRDRASVVNAMAFSEGVIAQIAAGTPGDLAWTRVRQTLADPSFLDVVPSHLWAEGERQVAWVSPFLKSIQNSLVSSLLDGRAATDRLTSAVRSFELDFEHAVGKEIEALSIRALRPLYLFAFPAVLTLVAAALAITVNHELAGV